MSGSSDKDSANFESGIEMTKTTTETLSETWSDEELSFFSALETGNQADINVDSTPKLEAESNSIPAEPIRLIDSEANSNTKIDAHAQTNKTRKQWRGRREGVSILMISIICALLLSTLGVITLTIMGKLPAMSHLLSTNSTVTDKESQMDTTAVAVQNAPLDQQSNDNTLGSVSNLDKQPKVQDVRQDSINNRVASNNQTALQQTSQVQVAKSSSDYDRSGLSDSAINKGSSQDKITVEEFKEEAKTTLYREEP